MAGVRFDPRKADKLINPKRYELITPEKTIERFGIKQGDIVADLGAGNGVFTIPIAEKTKTKVYAVDIEPQMLTLLEERAKKANLDEIVYVTSDLQDIKIEDHSVDHALISLVLHEVSDLKLVLAAVKRILKTDGQLLIIEWEAVDSKMGPPLNERISSNAMKKILEKNDFKVEIVELAPVIYGMIAKPI
ncbi:hypothetical protein BTR23_24050 [Alkalihalophilus pseudofirmus]|nr:hypothetical protein BTR23_24050 [Alkalihalophilus pseudofirmus]